MSNVPDDWNCYYRTCQACGNRYHESEGGCPCYEERAEKAYTELLDQLCKATKLNLERCTCKYRQEDQLGDFTEPGKPCIYLFVKLFIEYKNGYHFRYDEVHLTEKNWVVIMKDLGLTVEPGPPEE